MRFGRHFGRIFSVEAGCAIALAEVAAGNLFNIVNAEVSERVNADNLCYLLNRVMAGNEVVT